MVKWAKLDTLLRNVTAEEQEERYGIPSQEEPYIIRPVVIDLTRVETYTAMFGDGGEEIETQSLMTMHSGVEIAVNISFQKLDELIRKATL